LLNEGWGGLQPLDLLISRLFLVYIVLQCMLAIQLIYHCISGIHSIIYMIFGDYPSPKYYHNTITKNLTDNPIGFHDNVNELSKHKILKTGYFSGLS
jgi:hypothetical protein